MMWGEIFLIELYYQYKRRLMIAVISIEISSQLYWMDHAILHFTYLWNK
jgi:hypothetical protein